LESALFFLLAQITWRRDMKTRPKLNKVEDDLGCLQIFHAGDYAPDKPKDYGLDAWIGPPAGATTPATRRICDKCIVKIQKKTEGVWRGYEYDPENGQVHPICGGG